MRRRTALGLGAVLAGSVLFGAGGTVAALSDTESMQAEAGAAALTLEVGPAAAGPLKPDRPIEIPLRADVMQGARVALRMSLVGDRGPGACADLPAAEVLVDVPSRLAPRSYKPCELEQELSLVTIDGADTAVDLILRLAVTPRQDKEGSASWQGTVRVSLLQVPGGFSDSQDVEVHVVTPPGQAGGNPGNGQVKDKNNRNTSTPATVGPPAPQVVPRESSGKPVSSPNAAMAEAADSGAVVDEPTTTSDADAGAVVDPPTTPTLAEGGGTDVEAGGA